MAEVPQNPLVTSLVIGDVLKDFTPSIEMTVSYNDRQVQNGDQLSPSTFYYKPVVKSRIDHKPEDFGSFFTLVMVDPDIPGEGEEHLHWLVTDMHAFTPNGIELVAYERPNPDLTLHRYVFALFKQPRRNCGITPPCRDHFNTKNFAEENDLGLPVAAVFFYSQEEIAPSENDLQFQMDL